MQFLQRNFLTSLGFTRSRTKIAFPSHLRRIRFWSYFNEQCGFRNHWFESSSSSISYAFGWARCYKINLIFRRIMMRYPASSTVPALCVIFTILVSFSRDNAIAVFASKAKINVVWKFFEWSGSERDSGVRKNFKQRWF